MNDESETISCDEHGESQATFVCEHLIAEPVQRWHCNAPSEDNRWPDAWCEKCDAEFLKEGEWNENNEKNVRIKLLCAECYELLKGKSVERLTGQELERWNSFVVDAHKELSDKQAIWKENFEIGKYKNWNWNQDDAELTFSNDDTPAIRCDIAFVGGVSTKSNTWLWSWANYSLIEKVRAPLAAVREFGYEQDYPKLFIPKWRAEEVDGWEMAAIATKILDAESVYRTPSNYGFTFLVVLKTQRMQ